ncbi:tubulin monoglutamylase TTLL4 [Neosynchiropus ocellatus]
MPTNQLPPWVCGQLRNCAKTVHPTTVPAGKHAETPAPSRLPISRGSRERSPVTSDISSHDPPLGLKAALENKRTSSTDSQMKRSAIPSQCLNNVRESQEAAVLIQACDNFMDTNASPCIAKNPGFIVESMAPTQKLQSVQILGSHQAGKKESMKMELRLESPPTEMAVINVSPPLQKNKPMPETLDTLPPSVQSQCLSTLCEHKGAALRKHARNLNAAKLHRKSTRTKRRCPLAKSATKNSERLTRQSGALTSPLLVVGCPPPIVSGVNARCTTQTAMHASEATEEGGKSTCRSFAVQNGTMPVVPSATRDEMNSSPETVQGALMGSVTSKISAIHLTCPGQTSVDSSFSTASPPSDRDADLSGCESVMQVDVEEELIGELENSDNESDSLCIIRPSPLSSQSQLSGTVEPMSLEVEADREEKPALVQSLFPLFPPTLYFGTADEKVEMLPVGKRRLLKWKITSVTPNIVKNTITRSHFKPTKKEHNWLGYWGNHIKSVAFKAIGVHQKLNHFPGTFQIGRKDKLWRNLSKMQHRYGKKEFNFFPRTFVLPQDIKLLRKAWEDGSSRQKWIIKPPASARGIGIQVIHKWSQMPRKRPLLVQKYLHKPYLISGNKFDLRIYVYVTSYNPLQIYIFNDGLVRFASCKYSASIKTLSNRFMHLTNYSVNKKNSEYQSNSDDKACQGHKWALKALWQYLGSRGVDTTRIWEKIKDIVIKTVIASEPHVHSMMKMHVRSQYCCHELFGFDIMLDEKLKPWILEVNISPSLHSSSQLDVAIKGQMIKDLLNLAGFRIPEKEDVVAPCTSSASSSTSSLCSVSRDKTKPEVSADEKVKQAVYLTQRYADQDFLSTMLDVLTPGDVRVLAESEDELSRRGQFERIFPSQSSSRYLRFFDVPRYYNILLDQWEQRHWGTRSKGISLLTTLCQKGVHLGTNDPAHMWTKCSYNSKFMPHEQQDDIPSRSSVVVSRQEQVDEEEDSSDRDGSVSSPGISQSPGSSVTSSACASPLPSP